MFPFRRNASKALLPALLTLLLQVSAVAQTSRKPESPAPGAASQRTWMGGSSTVPSAGGEQPGARARTVADYGNIPLSFESNQGQSDPKVLFLAHGRGYGILLTGHEAVLTLSKDYSADAANESKRRQAERFRLDLPGAKANVQPQGERRLPGAANYFIGNDPAQWRTGVPTYGQVRFAQVYDGVDLVYYGNHRQLEYDFVVAPHADPSRIRMRFAGAQRIEIAPDGDLAVIGRHGQIAFRKPDLYQEVDGRRLAVEGSFALLNKHTIQFRVGRYNHEQPLTIDPVLVYSTYLGGNATNGIFTASGNSGQAVTVDAAGNVYVGGYTYAADYQVTAGALQTTNNGLAVLGGNAFIAKYNASGALVFATYLGGSDESPYEGLTPYTDSVNGIAVDSSGNVYVAGETESPNFPTTAGSFQPSISQLVQSGVCGVVGLENDIAIGFVAKLNPTGSALIYSTYLDGTATQTANPANPCPTSPIYALAINSAGDAYVAGATSATNFPVTAGAYQQTNHSLGNLLGLTSLSYSNGFVAELNPSGSAVLNATYLGGGNLDGISSLRLDSAGNIYVAGQATSTDFPVSSGAFQTSFHEPVTGVSGTYYTSLLYLRHTNVPYLGAGGSPFVAKLNPTASTLLYSTFLGGSGTDQQTALAIDSSGDAYVAGATTSTDFPVTSGAFQTVNHAAGVSSNGFVSKLNPTGTALVYSTYLGGSIPAVPAGSYQALADGISSIAVDAAGNAYVGGTAGSLDFPVSAGALQPQSNISKCILNDSNGVGGGQNGIATEINPQGTGLVYSTYIGGDGKDAGVITISDPAEIIEALTLDSANHVYITGTAYSLDFPLTYTSAQSSPDLAYLGFTAFLSELDLTAKAATPVVTLSPASITSAPNQPVTVTATVATQGGGAAPTGTILLQSTGEGSNTLASPILIPATLSGGSFQFTIPANSFPAGTFCLTANYTPDAASYPTYSPAAGQGLVTLTAPTGVAVTVTTTPSELGITVDGTSYTAPQTFTWNAGDTHTLGTTTPQAYGPPSLGIQEVFASWSDGGALSHTITVPSAATTYTASFTQTTTAKTTPTVTVAPSPSSITAAQSLSVTVTVGGTPTPTGSVVLASGSYTSTASTLSSGSATITIPAGSLATGTDTLTATYSPDSSSSSTYNSATGTSTETVTAAPSGPITASPATVNFGTANVGSTSSAVSVTFTVPSAVTLSKLAALTRGSASLDFTIQTSGTTCAAGAQLAGSSCTVSLTFSPLYPGPRFGALVLYDNSSPAQAVATVYLTGIGQAPLFAIVPGVMTTIAGNGTAATSGDGGQATSASLVPVNMALDGAGDIFVQDSSSLSAVIRRIDATSGVITAFAGGGSGCANQTDSLGDGCTASQARFSIDNSPGVGPSSYYVNRFVLDGAGNFYTTDLLPSTSAPSGYTWIIRKIDAASGNVSNVTPTNTSIPLCTGGGGLNPTVSNGICSLQVAAVGATGNVYLIQIESNANTSLLTLSPQTSALTSVVSGFQNPCIGTVICLGGGSIDAQGNLLLADEGGNVQEVSPSTGASTVWSGPQLGCDDNYTDPILRMDAAGDGYFAPGSQGSLNQTVVCEAGPAAQSAVYYAGTDNYPWPFNGDNIPATQANIALVGDIELDAKGNLYISDSGNNRIRKDTVGTGTPIVFPSTAKGATSAPIDVAIQNIGNAALSLSSLSVSPQFTINNSGTTCTQGMAITPGTTCTLAIAFAPTTTGTVTGTINFGDNSLNATSTSQILLSGTATGASAATPVVTVTPSQSSITTAQALSVTVTVGGTPTPTGSVVLTSGSYSSAATTLTSGSATITIPAGSLATGTDTVTAAYTPDSNSSSTYTSATGTANETVTALTMPVVTVTPASSSVTTIQTLSVTIALACGKGCPTGSVVLSSGGYTSASTTLSAGSATIVIPAGVLAVGTDALTATYTPDSGSSSIYTSATGTASVTVAQAITTVTPTVTVTPASSSITTAQSLSVAISVSSSTPCTTVRRKLTAEAVVPETGCTSATATGSVVLAGGGYTSAATTLSGGAASIVIPAGALTTGTDTLTATYTPDANSSSTYTSATATTAITVTTPVVTAPGASLTPAGPLVFTASTGSTSAAQSATLTNTGNAALSISSIAIVGAGASSFAQTNTCGASLAAGANCAISITFTPTSAATFTATLSVADNASGSPQSITVNGTGTAPTTFTIAAGTPTGTASPTTAATYTITVTPQNGSFNSPVTFSASGLPAGYIATFTPPSVTPGSSAASTKLTIQSGAVGLARASKIAVPALAFLGVLFWPARRRRRLLGLCAIALASLGAVTALSGCGGGFALLKPTQTYTVTIAATGAGQTQTTTVLLTVQQ